MKTIRFSLPGIEEFKKLNLYFLALHKEHSELFYDQVRIDNVYGSFPMMTWNGGRYSREGSISFNESERIFSEYEKYNTKLRFTFTNMLVSAPDLYDKYGNELLNQIQRHSGEVTIYSYLLEQYIRTHYPSIPLISSTTKCITDINRLNQELSRNYALVVLDFRKNSDITFLKKIREPQRVELLLNESCKANCKNRSRHYRDISKNIIMPNSAPTSESYCIGKFRNLYDSFSQRETIRVEDLYDQYASMGFNHAKICGRRGDFFNVLESYLYYLIKPAYKDAVRLFALQSDLQESDSLERF